MKNRNHEVDNARKILGIPRHATADETKEKYHELAKIWHPDINSNEDAPIKMKDINKAYALLMKEEFGILEPWEEYNRWWWRQYGNDPIWSNYISGDEEHTEKPNKQNKLPRG